MHNSTLDVWNTLLFRLDNLYPFKKEWHTGGKKYTLELKFRKSSKTIVSLFPLENSIDIMLIFGGNERECFENTRNTMPSDILECYDDAKTYHDGKWVMFNSVKNDVNIIFDKLIPIKLYTVLK